MNVLHKDIQYILEKFHSTFDKRGELPAYTRAQLYKQIHLFSKNKNNLAHYLRAKLELSCAWKVLSNWEYCEFDDGSVRALLGMAENFLHGEGELKELEKRKNFLYTDLENVMNKGQEYFVAAYAGFACISAVNSVLYDINLDTLSLPEIENEPDDWTACFLASISYCGGATWEEGVGDDLKRREFWEWFLNEAVPALWQI